MFFIYSFLLATFVQPGFFQLCSDDQIGQIIPGDPCDINKCLSLSQDTFETIGKEDLKAYTWTKGDDALIGYCPLNINFAFAPSNYGTTMNVTLTITTRSGKDCDKVQSASRYYTAQPDPGSGNYSVLTTKVGGETWQMCHVFQLYNGAFVCRACRVDPLPEPGNGYGYIYVFYRPKGDCQQDEVHKFLDNYDVYWEEIGVDCSAPILP